MAGAVTDDPPDFALRRHGLGAEAARRPELGIDGLPLGATPVPPLGCVGRAGGFARVPTDAPNVQRLGNVGDESQIGHAPSQARERARKIRADGMTRRWRAGDRMIGSGAVAAALSLNSMPVSRLQENAVIAVRRCAFGASTWKSGDVTVWAVRPTRRLFPSALTARG